jgi:hypothetical protein
LDSSSLLIMQRFLSAAFRRGLGAHEDGDGQEVRAPALPSDGAFAEAVDRREAAMPWIIRGLL